MTGVRAPLLCLCLGTAVPLAMVRPAAAEQACAPKLERMARVELYFGAGRVPPAAWRRFLREAVTPRFPDGLTTFSASGQWRGPRGTVAEPTRVVVILYRARPGRDEAIEAIRAAYKKRFRQLSVLRVDGGGCVGF